MKFFLISILLIVFLFPLMVLAVFTCLTKKHQDLEEVPVEDDGAKALAIGKTIKLTTFNIGYCGLDKDQDFFMDGGKGAGSQSIGKTYENLKNIEEHLMRLDSDIFLLQEIDIRSKRSFNVNQYEAIKSKVKHYDSAFAYNYNALWVPLPLFKPMGYANSGLATFSRFKIKQARRLAFKAQESWPRRLAELNRCVLETRIELPGGKTLVFVNLHLSAYDKSGKIRKKQTEELIALMSKYHLKGYYVVLGGDFNQVLSQSLIEGKVLPDWLVQPSKELLDTEYLLAVDERVPTVRTLEKPYVKGENFECVIDGFLVSPNIEILSVRGHDFGFECSDHNPVTLEIMIK